MVNNSPISTKQTNTSHIKSLNTKHVDHHYLLYRCLET